MVTEPSTGELKSPYSAKGEYYLEEHFNVILKESR